MYGGSLRTTLQAYREPQPQTRFPALPRRRRAGDAAGARAALHGPAGTRGSSPPRPAETRPRTGRLLLSPRASSGSCPPRGSAALGCRDAPAQPGAALGGGGCRCRCHCRGHAHSPAMQNILPMLKINLWTSGAVGRGWGDPQRPPGPALDGPRCPGASGSGSIPSRPPQVVFASFAPNAATALERER